MRTYTIIFTLVLTFSTLLSYIMYVLDIPISQKVLATKDLMLMVGLTLVLPNILMRTMRFRVEKLDWLIIATVIVNIIGFTLSDAPMSDRVVNLRRNVSLFLVLVVFREYGTGFRLEKSYFQFLKIMIVVLGVFGVIEFFLPDAFWDSVIGIPDYWSSLSLDPFATSKIGESGRFYSWDLDGLMGIGEVRRMVSFYFEPTTLAAFFLACLCFSLFSYQRERLWAWLIVGIGLLTMSKFFLMSILLAFAVIGLRDRLRNYMFLGFVTATILLSTSVVALDFQHGGLAHLKGIASLSEMVLQRRWLGLGLGAGGNYAAPDTELSEIGAESGFGNIVAQLGLMALVYVFLLNNIYVTLLNGYRRTNDRRYPVAIAALLCWTLSFFLSASSLGFSGNAFAFILIGSVLRSDVLERRREIAEKKFSLPVHFSQHPARIGSRYPIN